MAFAKVIDVIVEQYTKASDKDTFIQGLEKSN